MRTLAFLLALVALSRVQSPTPASPSNAMERIEAGRALLPNKTEVSYRIRLLPLASFPILPATVADQLQRRNCMIPQTYEARQPENVIHGAFENPSSDDWAVLCSTNGSTALYAFFQSQPDRPMMLRRQRDDEWLGTEAAGQYGSAWGITARTASQLRGATAHTTPVDHSGIEDSFVERYSSFHYFREGEWTTLNTK